MSKRILCFVLCIMLLFSFAVVGKSADDRMFYENEDYIALFEAMNILPEDFLNGDKLVTRGEFLTFLVSLMNFNPDTNSESSFSDVEDNTPLASALKIASALGIVSKGDKFYPNDIVTYPQAVKMVISALGYGAEANYRGGYPSGYMVVAQKLKMDVSHIDEKLNASGAINLFGQMCETYVNDITSVTIIDNAPDLVMTQGDMFLYHYHDIYTVSGVVEASDVSYLNDSTDSLAPLYVKINNVDYVVAGESDCSLGYFVTAYVKGNKGSANTIIHASSSQNIVNLISGDNDPVMSSGSFEYVQEDGKYKKLKCDNCYSVLYNGKAFENCTPADFSVLEGRIEAIDNDLDGDVDVFSIYEPEYVTVDYVDTFNKIIYDENYVNNIVLGTSDVVYASDTPLKNIKSGDTLEYFVSKDGKYTQIQCLKNKISGILEGYSSDEKLILNGISYGMTDYFKSHYFNLTKPGTEITVIISADNKGVSLKSYENDIAYGYLDAIAQKSGIENVCSVRIFADSGEVEVLELADKMRINDEVSTQAEAYLLLSNKTGEIIRFKKDASGKLKFVNTVMDELGLYVPSQDGLNNVKRYNFTNYDTTTPLPYKITGYFVPYFTIDSATKIFCVDESETSMKYRFSMGSGTAFLANDSRPASNTIWAYNVDEAGRADVILYKTDSNTATLNEESASGLVSSFGLSLDEDENPCYKIELYANDRFKSYYIEADSKFVASGDSSFVVGDFVRYTANNSGYITNIQKDFDNATKTVLGSTTDNTKNHYYYGDVYLMGDSSVALVRSQGDIVYLPIVLGDIGYISKSGVTTMPKNVIKTFKHIGDGCSKALVKCYYSSPQAVYIYE